MLSGREATHIHTDSERSEACPEPGRRSPRAAKTLRRRESRLRVVKTLRSSALAAQMQVALRVTLSGRFSTPSSLGFTKS